MLKKYFPHLLLSIYVIEFIICGIAPYDREVWKAENYPILIIVLFFTILYVRGIRFSNTAYLFIMILPFWHTIGGHYTFERVPFEWFNDFFGFERNMFDRVGHITAGLYAYPLMEYLIKWKKVSSKWVAAFTSVCFIGFLAMAYELVEWIYAVKEGGEAGAAFLGSQGDIWDAQKDMLMDTIGGLLSSFTYLITQGRKNA